MGNERGFTLAEMLVVCAIVGLVMASLLGLVLSGQQAYWFGTTQVDAQQTVRVAMERMVKEIREAGYEPLTPDSDPTTCPNATNYPLYTASTTCYRFYPITSQSATAVTLQYNWNGSTCTNPCTPIQNVLVTDPARCPATACRGEQITYALSGTDLTRRESVVDGSAVIIASGITALTFTYRDENGTVTSAGEAMRIVDVSITARTATNGAYVTMTDRVRLRNR